MKITVPLPLINKANTYTIHFNNKFWEVIAPYVRDLKKYIKKPLYWIAPTEEIKELERVIGFYALKELQSDHDGPYMLNLWISDRLDWDAIKVISDGIQSSGKLNDRQIKVGRVFKIPEPNKAFMFEIIPITEEQWKTSIQESLK